MHWILQTHVFNEERYAEIVGILQSGGIPYTPVRVIPFSEEMDPVPSHRGHRHHQHTRS